MKRYTINDNLLYKRIGDVIYILDKSNNQNVLFEFDNDIVNIGLHFFLKDVRPMLPPVMNRSIVDA